ncbi:unnamed protein product (macronuclear) [Paramecium tetraurelia]|uniref:Uncharacterized protein n=1 Tax=Paramecium tetraurelia TaxID=5888 RepID=A0D977_PARTE|nr:uncharacterized protein GSPATT00039335001 [Paramecium tetraurelia]CAK79594.1 unnamed protein product [Paramecium tetraurelia]|eukprot:XP_001446991.1 hypothetical protein (macronuclear) [Paramecium tetraurelia strain d4-2]
MSFIRVKCYKEQHQFIEQVCLNKQCQANRIYCQQCLQDGDHVAHPKDQKNLFDQKIFQNIDQKSESQSQDYVQ